MKNLSAITENLDITTKEYVDDTVQYIPFGKVDSTSTSTNYTATVNGITKLDDGVTVMLYNGIVTSASGFTININNLGGKPVYSNMATGNNITPTDPTRETTIFNINYTLLLIYSTEIVEGGGWICYRGYDTNTNTIGYQIRGNSSTKPASDKGYRYRLWLSSLDNQTWVPINTSTSTDATTSRTLNTRVIDPFGEIVYYSTNDTTNAGSNLTATTIWQQYAFTLGYSYVKTLTSGDPVYLKCTPQTSGGAVMNDIVQVLPSTNDGFIYIYLGIAYSTTAMELRFYHPVYYHDGTGIRLWTGKTIPTKTSDLTNDRGFSTVHVIPFTTEYDTELEQEIVTLTGATYADIVDWLNAQELVVLDSRGSGQSFYPCGSDRGEVDFANMSGAVIHYFQDDYGIITYVSYEAYDIGYDNYSSGLTATNVQDAIDEVISDIPTIPANTGNSTTGISIADHTTTSITGVSGSSSIYGVQSTTTTVRGVKTGTNSTTTASKASGANGTTPTLGTAISITGVQSSTTTASKASGANSTIPSLLMQMDTTDTKQLNITFNQGTASTWSFSDITVPIKNTSATSIPNVTDVGSASTWSFTDVDVPIRADADTTVPIKNTASTTVPTAAASATTVVTGKTHSITDNGHTHTLE